MRKRFRKMLAVLLVIVMIALMIPFGMFTVGATSFSPRYSAPSSSDSYFYSQNPFYKTGYGMPNCTCYAYGRAYELLGTEPSLSRGNAGYWWWYNKSNGIYPYGSTPKLGAIACWDKYDQNQGHVAVVEAIDGNSVTISESHYSGTYFDTRTINSNSSNYLTSMRFLGYIYIGDFEDEPVKNAWLNINRSEIVTGESIIFSFGAENGNGLFTIGIDKGDNRIYTADTEDNTISYTFNESGEYSAYVTAYGNGTLSDSNRVYFRVYPNVPASNAWLTIDKESIETGQSITFSFGADNSAGIYTIGIDKDNNRIHTEDIRSNSFTYTFNEAGNYSAYVTCYGYGGLADTQRVYFNVYSYSIMDINFWVDGKEQISIDGIGTVQVYVDGQLQKQGNATPYSDFYQNVLVGKPYEVKVNITNSNYHFGGVDTFDYGYSGQAGITSADGTLVRLVIVKDSDGITDIPDGDYLLASVIDPSYGLDIDGNSIPANDGDNVNINPLGNTPRIQDVFTLKKLDNGYYTITQKGTDMAVGVYGASCNRWGEVNMWNYNTSLDANARQWKICYDNTIGGYTFQAKCSGMYMTIDGGVMQENMNVYQNIKSIIPKAQGWKLRRLINDNMVLVSDVVIHSNADEIIPKITVAADNTPLVKSIDYQTSVIIDIEKGKGKVIVNGINNYCNSITKEFEIRNIPIIIGDATLDSKINIKDVTAIQRHLSGLEVFTNDQLALVDTNGDGKVDISDATHLQKYLAEFDGIVLGKQS